MGQPGIKRNVENKDEPILLFELFFDDSLVDLIVDQTNLYAKQHLENLEAGRQSDLEQRLGKIPIVVKEDCTSIARNNSKAKTNLVFHQKQFLVYSRFAKIMGGD